MMRALLLPTALSLLATTSALSIGTRRDPPPLPLLIWHGLGDRYDADGLRSVGDLAQQVHPGTSVYYIRLDDDGSSDRTTTFFGNLTEQVAQVCEDLHNEHRLFDTATQTIRVDALGFSQGGQFLRGLVERCDDLSVRSLVTFGSQHNGIAGIKPCGTWDLLCKSAVALMQNNIWTQTVQSRVVPAQYFRSVNETTGLASGEYLENSNFLADINNERTDKNKTYAKRIAALEKFVMFVFENDTTVIPPQSGWFAEVNETSGKVTPLRERQLYKEDWLGLKELDEKDGLVFKTTPGDHMRLDEEILIETFEEFFGPVRKASSSIDQLKAICGFNEANKWYPPWDWRFWAGIRDRWVRPGPWNYDPNDWEQQLLHDLK